jgi:hypothetical protein
MQQPLTTHLCPRNFLSSCPVSTLHIRTLKSPLRSPLQEATSEPSAEKLTPWTCELYFGCKLVATGRLRLSPAERGRLATFRKMQSPVALELLELLARSHIPQPDRPVERPTDKQGGIRRIETDAIYITAAIFSNVRFLFNFSTPLPR